MPDDDLRQKVHARVDSQDAIREDELCKFLSEQIVHYKIPRSFKFVNYPLRDDAGKACVRHSHRNEVKDQFWENVAWYGQIPGHAVYLVACEKRPNICFLWKYDVLG